MQHQHQQRSEMDVKRALLHLDASTIKTAIDVIKEFTNMNMPTNIRDMNENVAAEALLECTASLPNKTSLYADLVMAFFQMQQQEEDMTTTTTATTGTGTGRTGFISQLVDLLPLRLIQAVESGSETLIRLFLRFCAALTARGLVQAKSLLTGVMLRLVNDVAAKMTTEAGDVAQRGADMVVRQVMLALPWIGDDLLSLMATTQHFAEDAHHHDDDSIANQSGSSGAIKTELEALMNGLRNYMNVRRAILDVALRVLPVAQDTMESLGRRAEDETMECWAATEEMLDHLASAASSREGEPEAGASDDQAKRTMRGVPKPSSFLYNGDVPAAPRTQQNEKQRIAGEDQDKEMQHKNGGTEAATKTMNSTISFDASIFSFHLPVGPLPTPPVPKSIAAAGSMYQQRVRLRFLPQNKTEEKGLLLADRILVEYLIADTLEAYDGDTERCVLQLASLPVSFTYEIILVEAIFSHILALPVSPQRQVWYTVVFARVSKHFPPNLRGRVAAGIGTIMNMLVDGGKLRSMDVEVSLRLAEWHAHHLSLIKFDWPWQYFSRVASLPETDVCRVFVREVLSRLLRLSYHKRILDLLPEVLKPVMPPPPAPVFVPRTDSASTAFLEELLGKMRGKLPAADLRAWMNAWETQQASAAQASATAAAAAAAAATGPPTTESARDLPVEKSEQRDGNGTTTTSSPLLKDKDECIVEAVLQMGARTYSHTVIIMERYISVLQRVPAMTLLHVTSKVWRQSSQYIVLVFDRLMALRLVSNLDIASWAFSSEQGLATGGIHPQVWEVLIGAANKTVARAQDHERDSAALAEIAAAAEQEAQYAEEMLASEEREDAELSRRKAEAARLIANKKREEADKASAGFISAHTEKLGFFKALIELFESHLSDRLAMLPEGEEPPELKWAISMLMCIARKYRVDVSEVMPAAVWEMSVPSSRGRPAHAHDQDDNPSYEGAAGAQHHMRDTGEMEKAKVVGFDIASIDPRIRAALLAGIGVASTNYA